LTGLKTTRNINIIFKDEMGKNSIKKITKKHGLTGLKTTQNINMIFNDEMEKNSIKKITKKQFERKPE
jgi:hypothetical protein